MAGATLVTDAVLLGRRESGEKGLLLTFLSPAHGLLRAFKRTSASRTGKQPLPDLFDEVTVTLEHGREGDLWFVREYIVRHRRTAIGANYPSLLYASRFATVLVHHIFSAEEAGGCHALLRQALDAWETHRRPEVTYFKTLYLFARQQGIPAREEWIPSLAAPQASQVTAILKEPLSRQQVAPPLVEKLVASFEQYLHHQHEVRLTD